MNATYSTKQFFYNSTIKEFSAEQSELGWEVGQRGLKQIYPDSCDEGLTLVSHVTGRECDYVVTQENDHFMMLVPVSGRKGLNGKGTRIMIIND